MVCINKERRWFFLDGATLSTQGWQCLKRTMVTFYRGMFGFDDGLLLVVCFCGRF